MSDWSPGIQKVLDHVVATSRDGTVTRYAYWQHPMPDPIRLCPVEHRWRWTAWLHWQWWELRDRLGDELMILGAKIAGQWEPLP